jgi:hypothetical protein
MLPGGRRWISADLDTSARRLPSSRRGAMVSDEHRDEATFIQRDGRIVLPDAVYCDRRRSPRV